MEMNPSWRRPISNWREGGREEERRGWEGGREGGGEGGEEGSREGRRGERCDWRKREREKGSKSN